MNRVVTQVDNAQETPINLSAVLEAPETTEEQQQTGEALTDDTDTTVVANGADPTAKIDPNKAADIVADKLHNAELSDASKEEINELRGMLRTLRNENISLQARISAAERVQKGDFGTDGKNVEPTELEIYQAKVEEARQRDFSDLIAVMEVNPKYEDLHSVCSTANVSDIFEAVARHRSDQNATAFNVEFLKVQAEVWSMPNPYRYMYDIIKQYHPRYATTAEDTSAQETSRAGKQTDNLAAKSVITTTKAPGTVATLGGGATDAAAGWTSARIDAMPEDQLHTIPKDIHRKWLMGELT